MRLFTCVSSSASAERIFSCMGWFHTKSRNRLRPAKVDKMVFIKINETTANERLEMLKHMQSEEEKHLEEEIGQSDEAESTTGTGENNGSESDSGDELIEHESDATEDISDN